MDADNVSKCDAKKIKLAVSYGSDSATSKAKWFKAFKEEIKGIHEKMIKDEDNKGLIEKIKNSKKHINIGTEGVNVGNVKKYDDSGRKCEVYNLAGKLCGHLMCEIENQILVACVGYLKNEKIPIKNLVLCFDGFMINKNIFTSSYEILEKMSTYAEKKTGYKMKFVSKPQNEILNLEGLNLKKINHKVVSNDEEACNTLLEEMNGYIYSCKNNLYVKTKLNNIWTNNDSDVDREIVNTILGMDIVTMDNFGRYKTYSKDITGVNTLLKLIRYKCPVNENLIETIRTHSKGKIFFSDGVYDFSSGKFRQETDEDMTPIRINRKYNSNIDETTKTELIKLMNSIFEEDKQTVNMLQHGARGLAGCIEDKDFVVGTGLRDCGKGIITQLFTQAFGVYATEVNANNFIGTKRIGVSDEAKNRMWLLPHMWSRLLFANECDIDNGSEKATINGVLIKSLMSGGDVQKARALYKSEIDFIFNGRLIMFMNDLPEIKPVDTCQHMTLFEFPNKFIMPEDYCEKKKNKELQPYEKKADPNLKEKLKNEKYIDAFIQLVFENYTDNPVKNTEKIIKAIKEYRLEGGDELLYYKETFDYSDPSVFTSSLEIYSEIEKKYPSMSHQKIKSFLTKNMKLKYYKKQIEGNRSWGFEGLKIRNIEPEVNFFNE
jgi:ribosomal protein L30/L7E